MKLKNKQTTYILEPVFNSFLMLRHVCQHPNNDKIPLRFIIYFWFRNWDQNGCVFFNEKTSLNFILNVKVLQVSTWTEVW